MIAERRSQSPIHHRCGLDSWGRASAPIFAGKRTAKKTSKRRLKGKACQKKVLPIQSARKRSVGMLDCKRRRLNIAELLYTIMAFERDPHKLFPHDHLLKYTVLPLIPAAVTPNAVTVLRFILTPFVLWFLYAENYAVGVPLFLFTAFTDALDGTLARVRNNITAWGTFYDPVADKILIGAVVLLIVAKYINLWFALVILGIEALIIIGGYWRRSNGHFTSANIFGKTKMFLQVLGVTFLLIAVWSGVSLFLPASVATLSLAIAFAIVSLFTYGL